MIDFALNNAGDIILEHKETYDIFKLSFVDSGYPVFKTNFHMLNNPPTKKDTVLFGYVLQLIKMNLLIKK